MSVGFGLVCIFTSDNSPPFKRMRMKWGTHINMLGSIIIDWIINKIYSDYIYLVDSEIEILGEAMPLEVSSEIEVLREAVPLEDTCGFVPLAEEPTLRVTEVGEIGAVAGTSGLASSFLITASVEGKQALAELASVEGRQHSGSRAW